MPRILDEGVADDYEWIEIDRIPGRPMYEVWSDVSVAARRHATSHLAECVTAIQEFEPNASYLWAKFDRWDEHVLAAVDRSLSRAQGIVPDGMIAEARDFAHDNSAHLEDVPRVTCHGDLWFGNLLADSNGRLVGIIDWDRLAVAPPDYEIDMIWRFWRYPWDFVPGDFAATYEDELDPSLLNDVLEASSGGLSPGRIAARLGLLELAYRMGVTARFSWSEKHRRMLDTVLSGRWTERLFEH